MPSTKKIDYPAKPASVARIAGDASGRRLARKESLPKDSLREKEIIPLGPKDLDSNPLALEPPTVNEERFRAIIEQLAIPVVMIDSNRKVTLWNRMAEVKSGWIAAEQAIGRDAIEVLPLRESELTELLEGAGLSPDGIKIRTAHDRIDVHGTYDVKAFAIHDEICLLFEEIRDTDVKNAARRASSTMPSGLDPQKQIEDDKLFSQLFDELGEGIIISDRTGQIVRANKAAIQILGIPADELRAIKHDDPIWQAIRMDGSLVPISDLPGVLASREKRPVSGLELGIVRPDGKLTWILESAAPLVNDQGEVTGVIVTFPEITAVVRQQQILRQLNEKYQYERDRANEANRLKSSFLASMSHEIRTPMTAILGFSDVLTSELSGKVSEQHYIFLRSINVSGKRLLNLINDILDLSKIESTRLELDGKDLDVRVEIDAAIIPLSWIAKQKSLAVHVQHYPERLNIYGDRQRLGQVLTNIISNAIKFTRTGAITVRTLLLPKSSPNEPQQVAIEIEDTGIGISEEFIPHLFEEFRQEHSGQTKEFGGTGLGLAISRRLITLMDGAIQVRSEVGKGSVFTVLLPLAEPGAHDVEQETAELESDELESDETSDIFIPLPTTQPKSVPNLDGPALLQRQPAPPQKEPAPPQREPAPPQREPHVLIVEDNIETQRLIEVYLKGGYRVTKVSNAQEVFAALRTDKPDLILMDVNLPGKDGLAITREIRKGTICPKIPIVALTAFAMTGDRQRCIDAGCTDYLSKPATKREVLAMLAKCLQDTPQ